MLSDLNSIEILEKKYGSPFYVFDKDAFLKNYHHFIETMQNGYDKYRLSYSFKTNYTPYICKKICDLGGYAEVVSAMEYEIALKVGFDPKRIIFNGPDKIQEIDKPLLLGSMVNADSVEEVRAICSFASNHPSAKFKIGLRVNLNIGQEFTSRFGMDVNDLIQSFEIVNSIKNLIVTGLHCHISRCRDANAWKKRTELMLKLADDFFETPPEYIDLGSGMFGEMEPDFAAQFSNIPSYEDYADLTAKLVSSHYSKNDFEHKPVLFTEPGTTVINKYVSLVAKVDSIKSLNNKFFATLNCSEHNLGEVCTLKRLPITVVHVRQDEDYYNNMDFVGYTCLEQDVVYSDYNGKLGIGDYVVFGNVGGYSNVLKPPFIRPNCAMISIDADTDIIIKRAETVNDILATYTL